MLIKLGEGFESSERLWFKGRPRTGDDMAEQTDATTEQRPNPNEKLVKVFDSEQESEAMVVKGLLDSEGIENDLASASLLQDAFPGMGGMIILVREEDAEKARALIAASRQSAADQGNDDETES
jgi:Putative prokaryotic signal transducing protein